MRGPARAMAALVAKPHRRVCFVTAALFAGRLGDGWGEGPATATTRATASAGTQVASRPAPGLFADRPLHGRNRPGRPGARKWLRRPPTGHRDGGRTPAWPG